MVNTREEEREKKNKPPSQEEGRGREAKKSKEIEHPPKLGDDGRNSRLQVWFPVVGCPWL